jgi:intracellular multiplication protein IcmE
LNDVLVAFSVSEVMATGFVDLKKIAESTRVRADQLKAAGRTAAELKVFFNASQLRRVFKPNELLAAGFTLQELKSSGVTLPQFHSAGRSAAELKDIYTVKELLQNISVDKLVAAGYNLQELKAAGATALTFKNANYGVADLKSVFTVSELQGSKGRYGRGFNVVFSPAELRAAGLMDGSVDFTKLKADGWDASALKRAGHVCLQRLSFFMPFGFCCRLKLLLEIVAQRRLCTCRLPPSSEAPSHFTS